MSTPNIKGQLIEQPTIQIFTESLPRRLSGQVELVDLHTEVLP